MENFSKKNIIKNKYLILGLIISFIYLILFLFGFSIPYFYNNWQPQNFLIFTYPLLLCLTGMLYLPSEAKNIILSLLANIGKASYHIFLIQIVFFGAGFSLISLFKEINYLNFLITILLNCILIVTIGFIFFKLESISTNFLLKKYSIKIRF